jgi:S-adenosyl-L-methionine hydrolase (adenosine-forming)
MRPVALLTDFGLTDPYAGQMRAALARLAPGASVLDVSHMVEPFAVDQAALFLAASAPHFPPDAVFVCVVDPGVGSSRRVIGAHIPDPDDEQQGQDFLAPDNGLLGLVLASRGGARARTYDLGPAAEGYVASATFHGRDVLAPLAARLAAGELMAGLGRRLEPGELVRPDWAEAKPGRDGIDARVLHVDRYGNCLLSVRAELKPPRPVTGLRMSWGQRRPVLTARTYADLPAGAVGLLSGSQGFLELAVNQASAAEALGLRRGDSLRVLWEREA